MTLKDIAKKAQVSFQAVSMALNDENTGHLSPKKREEIRRIAAEMNYMPNRAARSLRTKSSKLIGVIFPGSMDDYFSELMHSMLWAFTNNGYHALFAFSMWEEDKTVRPLVTRMLAQGVDGLIAYGEPDTFGIPRVPTLFVSHAGCFTIPKNSDGIVIDIESTALDAVRYLKKLGHRKVGYAGAKSHYRFNAFLESIDRLGMETRPEWLTEGWGIPETGYEAAGKLIAVKERPSAVVAYNDTAAISLVNTLHESGFTIPGDFSVIGAYNIKNARYAFPPLTTYDMRVEDFGAELVGLILNRIANPSLPVIHKRIRPPRIDRESCAEPAQARKAVLEKISGKVRRNHPPGEWNGYAAQR